MSVVGAVLFDQLALNTIKYDIAHNIPSLVVLVFIFGGLAYYLLSQLIKREGIALANGNWNVISTIAGTICGAILWSEDIHTKQYVGIFVGILSLYLMDGI